MRAILTYHSIDPSGSVISMADSVFRNHVEWLGSGAVRVTGVEELLTLDPDEDAVAITFDDGFANFASTAWPVLKEHGLPATVFVVTDRAGGTNAWSDNEDPAIPELPLLDWDSLGRLAEEGVELGSHTRTHARLPGLEAERLTDEVAGAADVLEDRAGVRPAGFAYPYGALDRAAHRMVGDTYRWACTTELGELPAAAEAHRLPRLDAYYYQTSGLLERWGSAPFRLHLWLRGGARRFRALVTSSRDSHG